MRKLKVVFLAYYPIKSLKERIEVINGIQEHPASWIVNLTNSIALHPSVELHVVGESAAIRNDTEVSIGRVTFHLIKQPPSFNLSTLYIRNARRLVRKIISLDPDIVHAHGCEGSIGIAGVSCRRPCLLSMQGIQSEIEYADKYWLGRSSLRVKLLAYIERYVVRKAKFIGVRTDFASAFVKRTNPKAKIYYTPEIINDVFFRVQPARDRSSILFVGTLSERKGVAILIRAMRFLCKKVPECQLNLVGIGSTEEVGRLNSLSRELGVDGHICFKGSLNQNEIASEMENTAVFVLPSFMENSPNSLAEAMSAGLAVVATNVGGIPSMVENNATGLLVPPGDEELLSEAIVDLLVDESKRRRLGQAAKTKAIATHSSQVVVDQIMKVYQDIMMEKAR